LRIGLLRQHCS